MIELPHYVINLSRSVDRRRTIEEKLNAMAVNYMLVTALDGHDESFSLSKYREFYYPFWGRRDSFRPGAFACYLSHAKCWQMIANGDSPHAVVLEDDASFNSNNLQAFAESSLECPFDLIFINYRTEQWLKAAALHGRSDLVDLSTLVTTLVLSGDFQPKVKAPGTDGYIVSREGAEKLLHMLASRKVCMGIDYAMTFNSITREQLHELEKASNGELPRELRFHVSREAELNDEIALRSFVYNRGYIVGSDGSPSTIGPAEKIDARPLFDAAND